MTEFEKLCRASLQFQQERRPEWQQIKQQKQMAVGPQLGGSGTTPTTRYGVTGDTIASAGHGKYTEASTRGVLFAACHNAGDAPGTTISTTAMLCLYNPQNSTVRLVVKRVYIAYVSGTIGTGTMFHCGNATPTQTAPTGTAATGGVVNCNIGNAAAAQGTPLWTASVVAPKVLTPFMTLAPILATSVITPVLTYEDLDGFISVQPGCSYQLQSNAAGGSTPLFATGIVWEEMTLLS